MHCQHCTCPERGHYQTKTQPHRPQLTIPLSALNASVYLTSFSYGLVIGGSWFRAPVRYTISVIIDTKQSAKSSFVGRHDWLMWRRNKCLKRRVEGLVLINPGTLVSELAAVI